jgi:hypothetical protein
MRTNERVENDEPRRKNSMRETQHTLPSFCRPWTLIPEPMLMNFLIEQLDPVDMKFNMLTADPARMNALTLTLLPQLRKSSALIALPQRA